MPPSPLVPTALKEKVRNFGFETTPVVSLRSPAQCNVPVIVNDLNVPKKKRTRGRIRTPTVVLRVTTLPHSHGINPISILIYKPSTLQNNTLFEISISRKTRKFLELFQSTYVLLLIKQDTRKVSTLRLHK